MRGAQGLCEALLPARGAQEHVTALPARRVSHRGSVSVLGVLPDRVLLTTPRGLLVAELAEREFAYLSRDARTLLARALSTQEREPALGVEHVIRFRAGGDTQWCGRRIPGLDEGVLTLTTYWYGAGEAIPEMMRAGELGDAARVPGYAVLPLELRGLLCVAHELAAEAGVDVWELHAQRLHWAHHDVRVCAMPIIGAQGEVLPPLGGEAAALRVLLLSEVSPDEPQLRAACEVLQERWTGSARELLETARLLLHGSGTIASQQ